MYEWIPVRQFRFIYVSCDLETARDDGRISYR
jgi:hypothetical protein